MRTFLIILMMWCCALSKAQRHIVFSDDIASLQVVAGQRWMDMPIVRLKGNEPLNISFDDLSHVYRRISYSITHLEADWKPTESLFPSDYIDGFYDGLTIEDNEESINTIQNYTHYKLQLPNKQCRIKMSGNYRLDIKDDNDNGRVLASAFFMVTEDIVNVGISYTDNTDIDVRKNHQQVNLNIDFSALNATNPRQQIKGYVIQNGKWNNARILPYPTQQTTKSFEWVHCKDLIFEAGNEYHRFEILDIHRNSLNVENNVWDGNTWHTILWADYNRPSYVYDEVPKGSFYIRNTNNIENDIASEYVNVHFILNSPKLQEKIFVNGTWTNDRFLPKYELIYDEEEKHYEAVIPLKYGYYSYQYLMIPEGNIIEGDITEDENVGINLTEPLIPPTEGSYYQTNNVYNALIYFKGNNDRTDRLVGVK